MNRKNIAIAIAVLLVLLILAYVPNIQQRGFTNDEWLTLFVKENKDAASLVEHYSIDRPLRGYFDKYTMIAFGTKMLHYQLTGLMFRFLETFFFFGILMILFPKRFPDNLLASALVLMFPGFLQQPHALDYQAHFASHAAMIAAFLICLLPIYYQKKWVYFFAIPLSIALFQVSVGIMELNIGMDLWRYFIIVVAINRFSDPQHRNFRNYFIQSLPYIISTLAFFVWRLFIFETGRVTVDSNVMLENVFNQNGLINLIGSLFSNLYRLIISAWYEPLGFYSKFITPELLPPLLILCAIGGMIVLGLYTNHKKNGDVTTSEKKSYAILLIIGGVIFALGSLVPVVFGGREIIFENARNRFTFPGMMGTVLIMVGLLNYFRIEVKYFVILFLVLSSLVVHYGNSVSYVKNYESVRASWWQFIWRVPDIVPRSTITGEIENGRLNENPTLWGPVNIIYYPNRKYVIVGAEILNSQTKEWIFEKAVVPQVKRLNGWDNDFGQVLIFSHPEGSCLQIIDGKHPEISNNSSSLILELATYSQINNIDPNSDKEPAINPDIFGPEPDHDWCYFYEKAQLARQTRDWELVTDFGIEAIEQNLNTNDKVEWIVFVQGFAYTQSPELSIAVDNLLSDEYSSEQACSVFSSYTDEMISTNYQIEHENLIEIVCK